MKLQTVFISPTLRLIGTRDDLYFYFKNETLLLNFALWYDAEYAVLNTEELALLRRLLNFAGDVLKKLETTAEDAELINSPEETGRKKELNE